VFLRRAPRELSVQFQTAGPCSQLLTLLSKHTTLSLRDPMLYVGRMGFFLIANLFFAIIYVHARQRKQDEAAYKLYLCMWFGAVPTAMGVAAVFVLNQELQAIRREVKEGMYSALAYIVAHTALQFIMMFVLAIFALGVPAYAVADFHLPTIGSMILVYAAMLWGFECLAQLESALHDATLIGMLEYLNIWFLAFLFAGVVINPVKVIWPLRVLAYVFPFRWGFAAITYTEFYPTHWSGAISCPLGYERGEFPPGCGHNGTGCMGDADSGGLFCCSDIAPKEAQLCHGHTGAQVLDSLHTAYKVVINENRVSEDIGIMCAIALVFKLFFTIIVWRKCNPHTQIKAPAPLAKPLEAIRQSLSAVSHVVSSKIGTASTKSAKMPVLRNDGADTVHDTI